uniref:Uncharacterized protein n=1 Tax=Anguilla anguilla TaxID=7936 RepID=A0A0E9S5T9_ANGAN
MHQHLFQIHAGILMQCTQNSKFLPKTPVHAMQKECRFLPLPATPSLCRLC